MAALDWNNALKSISNEKNIALTFLVGELLEVWMQHLSTDIQSNRSIILWCQPWWVELLDKSRFIMLVNELPLSPEDEIFKMRHFPFGGSELNGEWGGSSVCTHSHSLIMGTAGWHQLYRHSRHFTGITWQWTPVSACPLTAPKRQEKRKRESQREGRET